MVSQDDDSQQRVALFLVFGLVALVVAAVLFFGVNIGRAGKSAAAPAAQVTAPLAAASEPATPSVAQAASDAASVTVEQGVVKFYFASGKADLAAGASEALADVVKGAQAGRKLLISGFHDASGNAEKNAELAKQRALAVRDALKAAGVAEAQIELKKPEQLTGGGSDAEARRVEISLQ
ncbi:Outer membrane protein OmpA [Polaromonas sp. OV174]|uniref:OmpA family protein n=1 Tax=Polaromonas sp. OV174 TaxID=1855300 RepID=UPI0008E7C112|nr:OmpA family protein [Polaromonas sp. OV174]SFB77352.1 Outer membrane protein OmpA [Polaromonas sp. OV174]